VTQNIYDDPEFFRRYSGLPRSVEGLDGAPEWPALRALLPDLRGRRVLDLGCGFGWFCRWAREEGAARVEGLDVSERMLERARTDTSDAAITYRRADLETVTLPAGAFDVVYSSLAFHYLEQLERLVGEVHRALVPGGSVVFSVEHPIYTAPAEPGWVVNEAGVRTWPVEGYLDEGPRTTEWLAPGVVKRHRTLGTYVTMLLRAGFAITHVEEWGPTPAQVDARPEWADERRRPLFLLMSARR
jgi:SAM-dependent methyltransferase